MRRFLWAIVTLSILGSSTTAAERPNVVLIIGDDQAYGDFGFMKHPVLRTPNLDRLAAEGLAFTRGYVPSSLCRPSLATIITGLYAHQHGITSNDPPAGLARDESLAQRRRQIARIEAAATLPRLLGKQGYVSLQTGKWWEGDFRRGGFTEGMTHGDPARGGRHGDEGLKIGRTGMQPVFDFIDRAGDRPFFVWYAPMLPHQPHNPPERLLAKYRDKTPSLHVAKYWAMCEWFDETCGQLLDFLDRKNLSRRTLVVFLVDNGWIQDPKADRFAPKSKRSPYEGGLRTPILVRWPGHIAPQRDETTLVLSIDLVPTILAACGIEPPKACQGINLLDRRRLAQRKIVFGETFSHNAVDIDRPASSLEYRWCTDGRWKLIVPGGAAGKESSQPPVVELYDLAADPREDSNLAATQPEQVQRLRAALDAWWPGQ
ncbi:MAG: sulfatase [Thermoguttaceae bacterium]|nr:sulfatase [Thermoguttaceae bacterium]